ncbi:P-loop containing nucleoside triphosphate hydrolase protein [Daldinia caldariorum]|uniref:P-loop containing nucleoside triphosphate hydrolase protein n=1 Tax=Daldinia caldariorum TaxID=326644 RepID=UPI0020081114|nr:P-loop containing nucleoside triphosphate hydrolase protein [Daldinia caldariorum]KAI1464575.1 P-loop containing nucleoside triphosphate hydrolase protein [Daldinia caldariorum]
MSSSPSNEDISRVMAECPSCSRDTATNCLEMCENDVEKAIEKYRSIEEFLPPEPQSDNESLLSHSFIENDSQAETNQLDSPEVQEDGSVNGDNSWMPRLPSLSVSGAFIRRDPPDPEVFELRDLLAAIQAGRFDADRVRRHLGHYDKRKLPEYLNEAVDGYPAMFYIVSTNNVEIIREWIKHGGNPHAVWGPNAFPLLAFSIIKSGQTMLKASNTLKTLLRFSADPHVLPKAFYEPYCRDLPEGGPVQEELVDINDDNKRWCTEEVRARLSETLNLTQRYDLYRASKIKPRSGREKEVLNRQGAGEVLGLHQMIVAQSVATRWLQNKLLVNLALQKKKPFIVVFAGPSGHGKTELAKKFGELMSLELEEVDCTIFDKDMELFGPRPGIQGSEDGTKLNNFLARKSGQRSIIFMDEFEKTSEEIHNTLLLPFQDGRYEDRRNGKNIDCSKTIWILATNQLDEHIHAYCEANEQVLFHSEDQDAQDRLVEKLCRQLRKELTGSFGAPLSGRITEILPFLVFSPQEAAVIAHRQLMNLEAEVLRHVHLSLNKEEDVYVGNINISIKNDATICTTITRDEYDKQTGARSINLAVERIVQDPLVSKYLKDGDEFDENQPTTSFIIDVDVDGEIEVRLVS